MQRSDLTSEVQQRFPPLPIATGNSGATVWIFDLTGLSEPQLSYIFSRGLGEKYQIGIDRLIQKYLEIANFEVLVLIQPLFFKSSGRHAARHEQLSFWNLSTPSETRDLYLEYLKKSNPVSVAFGQIGRIEILAKEIWAGVNLSLEYMDHPEKKDLKLSITESSKHIWQNLSSNMAGVVHTWLQNDPVFRPETYVTKPTKKGCKLAVSDQVVIGLLYGMFSFGVKHNALRRPVTLSHKSVGA